MARPPASKVSDFFQRGFGLVLVAFVGMSVSGWDPPPIQPQAQLFWDAILAAGYVVPVIVLIYAIAGVAFLFNRYAALAAVLLAPVSVNIFLFHAFLNPRSLPFAVFFFTANVLMLYVQRHAYAPLLRSTGRDD